ncbi:hypothetical protein ACHAWF_008551 [Thalassiosira exigua]
MRKLWPCWHWGVAAVLHSPPQPPTATALALTVGAGAGAGSIVHLPSFVGVGITSVLPDPFPGGGSGGHFAGTKRGKVRRVELPTDAAIGDAIDAVEVRDVDAAGGGGAEGRGGARIYPIFSMLTLPNGDLLTGGGDRYVAAWRRKSSREDGEGGAIVREQAREWEEADRLGPHTGWVKDLAAWTRRDGTAVVFSIGCNRVEVWSTRGSAHVDTTYQHERTLMVESSVDMGSTLSSDLLCLATYIERRADGSTDDVVENCLLAGGVDGRVHRWRGQDDDGTIDEAGTFRAHDGRVNALAACEETNVLFSAGNDGQICCWTMDGDPSGWTCTSLDLGPRHDMSKQVDGTHSTAKVMSLCVVEDQSERALVAAGTSCGRIYLVDITKSEDGSPRLKVVGCGSIDGSEAGKECVVHALCCGRRGRVRDVIVGHSDGLSVWTIDNDEL